MQKESLLKKQFKTSDVNRLRNLIAGEYTKSTQIGVGYIKKEVSHKEGEIWIEDDKVWTVKNGLRQNISKLDTVKDMVNVPLVCPKCGGTMKHWLQKKMYRIYGFCFDPCTLQFEKQLKKDGLYKQYEKTILKSNAYHILGDLEQHLKEQTKQNTGIITEDGDIEDWTNTSDKNQNSKLNLFLKQVEELRQKFINEK